MTMKITADWDVTPYCLVSNNVSEKYCVIFKVAGSTNLI